MGMFAAALSAISALLSIPAYPFWSLCIFALAIIILYELAKAPEHRTQA
jgi:apolipoprotein N-acyltransferase